MKPMNLPHQLLVLATSVTLAGCADFGDDGDRYEKLDRLRVLGIRSEPADLIVGETAILRGHVFEPADRELSYQWSWCPYRADSSAGFECGISEPDLQRAWAAAGFDGPAPTYDLGTDSEARLTHLLKPELVSGLCQASGRDERLEIACFQGLEASVQLRVRSSDQEVTAIKSVRLLGDETPPAERNTNPSSSFGVTVRDGGRDVLVEDGEPLRAGRRYTLVADVDDGAAESFTPGTRPGEQRADERRETLVMTWFVTVGEVLAPDGDDGFGGDGNPRTTFVDGSNDIRDLLRNGWQLPLRAGPSAQLHLVLRDERGGVGWTTHRFAVMGGEK